MPPPAAGSMSDQSQAADRAVRVLNELASTLATLAQAAHANSQHQRRAGEVAEKFGRSLEELRGSMHRELRDMLVAIHFTSLEMERRGRYGGAGGGGGGSGGGAPGGGRGGGGGPKPFMPPLAPPAPSPHYGASAQAYNQVLSREASGVRAMRQRFGIKTRLLDTELHQDAQWQEVYKRHGLTPSSSAMGASYKGAGGVFSGVGLSGRRHDEAAMKRRFGWTTLMHERGHDVDSAGEKFLGVSGGFSGHKSWRGRADGDLKNWLSAPGRGRQFGIDPGVLAHVNSSERERFAQGYSIYSHSGAARQALPPSVRRYFDALNRKMNARFGGDASVSLMQGGGGGGGRGGGGHSGGFGSSVAAVSTFAAGLQLATTALVGWSKLLAGMVEAASPQMYRTLTGSFEILLATLGQDLIPHAMKLAMGVQKAAQDAERQTPEQKQRRAHFMTGGPIWDGLGGAYGGVADGYSRAFGKNDSAFDRVRGFGEAGIHLGVAAPRFAYSATRSMFGYGPDAYKAKDLGTPDTPKVSIKSQDPRISAVEQVWERMQLGFLGEDDITRDMARLQLIAMQSMLTELQELNNKKPPGRQEGGLK